MGKPLDFSLAKLGLGLGGRASGMTYRIQFEQWVPITIEKVFLFFAIRTICLASCLRAAELSWRR